MIDPGTLRFTTLLKLSPDAMENPILKIPNIVTPIGVFQPAFTIHKAVLEQTCPNLAGFPAELTRATWEIIMKLTLIRVPV